MKKLLAVICSLAILAGGIGMFSGCNNDDDLVGFDIDLAKAVAEKLDIDVECRLISWEAKETELSTGLIDVIWNGFTYDEDRAQNIDFTGYYMENKQVAIVSKSNESKYTDIESIKTQIKIDNTLSLYLNIIFIFSNLIRIY